MNAPFENKSVSMAVMHKTRVIQAETYIQLTSHSDNPQFQNNSVYENKTNSTHLSLQVYATNVVTHKRNFAKKIYSYTFHS